MSDWIMNNSAIMVSVGLVGSFLIMLFWAFNPFKRNIEEHAMIPFKEQAND